MVGCLPVSLGALPAHGDLLLELSFQVRAEGAVFEVAPAFALGPADRAPARAEAARVLRWPGQVQHVALADVGLGRWRDFGQAALPLGRLLVRGPVLAAGAAPAGAFACVVLGGPAAGVGGGAGTAARPKAGVVVVPAPELAVVVHQLFGLGQLPGLGLGHAAEYQRCLSVCTMSCYHRLLPIIEERVVLEDRPAPQIMPKSERRDKPPPLLRRDGLPSVQTPVLN